MLLIVILNAVLAVMIVTAMVALHIRAIAADRRQHGLLFAAQQRERPTRRVTHAPESRLARRTPRATRQPFASR